MGDILNLMGIFSRRPEPAKEEFGSLLRRVDALEEWAEKMERRWHEFLEEAEERIDRGNKQWRRVRAAQRREEELEDGEGEEEPHPDLFQGHENGGRAEGVPSMHHSMESRAFPESDWEAKKRAINRALAGMQS